MDLKDIREKIDIVDNQIKELYLKRLELVKKVAQYKKENNLPILSSDREKQLTDNLCKGLNEENRKDIKLLYEVIMSYSKLKQHAILNPVNFIEKNLFNIVKSDGKFKSDLKICCQGTEGAYSSISAKKMFKNPKIIFKPTFKSVINSVQCGECDFGVLPIENSTAGSVNEVYDLIYGSGLFINLASKISVNHCLAGIKGSTIKDIKKVYSHQQALNQCKNYIETHGFIPVENANTAMAAEFVFNTNDKSCAAISSEQACSIYGLEILDKNIQDAQHNYTRFIAVGKKNLYTENDDKSSLIVKLENRKNSLFNFMCIIAEYGYNITKLESRPIKGSDYEYNFYFDIEAKFADGRFKDMLEDMASYCKELIYLGGYREI